MRRGILLANTGSPNSYAPEDVKAYLREFLMDRHILSMPYFLRWFLVNKIIVERRAPLAAQRYEQIWLQDGSPLHVHGIQLAQRIEKFTNLPVVTGMNYAQPSFAESLKFLEEQGVVEVLVIPLFPQYAYSTYTSIENAIHKAAYQINSNWKVYIKKPYYNDSGFIDVYADFLEAHWQREERQKNSRHVLFSYHSIPTRYLQKVDTHKHCLQDENCCEQKNPAWERCYKKQTQITTQLLAKRLGLKKYSLSYQSQFLNRRWLSPFTDKSIEDLGSRNVAVSVVSPGFLIDNLETLEELSIRSREFFVQAGGQDFEVAPSLNALPALANVIGAWCTGENLHDFFYPLHKKA